MMNEMNWRFNNKFNNPESQVQVPVDRNLTQAFVSKPRTQEQVERFGLWASMSKEAKDIGPIFDTVRIMESERMKQVIR